MDLLGYVYYKDIFLYEQPVLNKMDLLFVTCVVYYFILILSLILFFFKCYKVILYIYIPPSAIVHCQLMRYNLFCLGRALQSLYYLWVSHHSLGPTCIDGRSAHHRPCHVSYPQHHIWQGHPIRGPIHTALLPVHGMWVQRQRLSVRYF